MVVEMLTGQISEHGNVEGGFRDAVLHQTMRRNFHRSPPTSVIPNLGQHPLQVVRLRSRVRRRDFFDAIVKLDCADQACAVMSRRE